MRLKRPASNNIGLDLDQNALDSYTAKNGDASGSGSHTIKNDDALTFLQSYTFTGNELVYCDPPYLHETRSKLNLYRHEMSHADHVRLLDILKSLPCMVMISGYRSDLYMDTLAEWNTKTFQAMTRAGRTATEYVWFNYPEPVALHDYSFLGKDYRERERIKRKKQRWVSRLQSMPKLERHALLCAIDEAWHS